MKVIFLFFYTLICSLSFNVLSIENTVSNQNTSTASSCASFLNHTFKKLNSTEQVDLCELTAGKTVLIINTASNCGFTPQFTALEAIHKKYKDQGLVVIGFPSDNFFQEEDDEKDTATVCFTNYGVTFTMLEVTTVLGRNVNPVFDYLGDVAARPKWNFYKYLVSDNGNKVQHFHTRIKPTADKFIEAIEESLAKTL